MFQRLIADRKFLATFYTLPSSAHLLAELAVDRLDVDWANADDVLRLRIADFACGTGALLSAAYHRVAARHRRAGGDDRALHAAMMERVLLGADIMPAATHLTASIVSSVHPDRDLRRHPHLHISGNPESNPPRGPFDVLPLLEGAVPTYPTLWGHNASRERNLIVQPDSRAEPRSGCRERAAAAWRRHATNLHFNRDFRINSQPLAACLTPDKALGGRAWPNFKLHDESWETPVVLWSNTTLGLMSFWWLGARQQQGRAILTLSTLPNLPVLDPRRLTDAQHAAAARLFAEFRDREFLPANEACRDETRQALDRAVLVDLLALPDDAMAPLDLLRRQWCAEPTVHGGKSTRPPNR